MSDPLDERSRLSARQAAAAEPAFSRIQVFEFYDGPESGIAQTETGATYRFQVIDESRHRRYRAYLLERLIDFAPASQADHPVWIPADVWQSVRQAAAGERYVGISDPYLGGLVVCRLPPGHLEPETFGEVHKLLRFKFRSARREAEGR